MPAAGSKLNRCAKGLHDMSEGSSNVWIRPSDGARYCKQCQKASRKERYLTLDEITGKPTEFTPRRQYRGKHPQPFIEEAF
jgi:hypothetical protein